MNEQEEMNEPQVNPVYIELWDIIRKYSPDKNTTGIWMIRISRQCIAPSKEKLFQIENELYDVMELKDITRTMEIMREWSK